MRTVIELRAPYGTVIMAYADGVYRLQCDTADLAAVKEWFSKLSVEAGNQHVQVLKLQLESAADQHKELVASQTYKPKHVQLKEQIAALQAQLAEESASISSAAQSVPSALSAPVVRVVPDDGTDRPMMPGVPHAQSS